MRFLERERDLEHLKEFRSIWESIRAFGRVLALVGEFWRARERVLEPMGEFKVFERVSEYLETL